MIHLHTLPKTTEEKKKRRGQGLGSGKGKTGGRGTKGQRTRGSIPKTMGEAGASFVKRLPLYRGKYRNKPKERKELVINLKYLNLYKPNTVVSLATLITTGILKKDQIGAKVKILGGGKLTIPLTVCLPVSKSAKKAIEAAGGKIDLVSAK